MTNENKGGILWSPESLQQEADDPLAEEILGNRVGYAVVHNLAGLPMSAAEGSLYSVICYAKSYFISYSPVCIRVVEGKSPFLPPKNPVVDPEIPDLVSCRYQVFPFPREAHTDGGNV